LRTYMGMMFDLGQTELTTGEFIRRVQDLPSVPEETKKGLTELVRSCDMAKFSPYLPGGSEAKVSLDMARKIIETIHDIMKPRESRI
jgi:hypothetical protein